MEQSLSKDSVDFLCSSVTGALKISGQDVRNYSPLALAFIGDCVYELIIRTIVIEDGAEPAGHLQEKSSFYAKASTQSQIVGIIRAHLSEDEATAYRRGRNAHPQNMAKNATVSEYRKATGLEALFGYLYVTDRFTRVLELVRLGIDGLDKQSTLGD